ncbi:MAG: HEAT repeat domain-containing protein [Planctomycetes bacterium]|nr:HEAT repeat domain-containing protein [Planctomycetota bacterium]
MLKNCDSGNGRRLLQIADLAAQYQIKDLCLEALSRASAANVDAAKIVASMAPVAAAELDGLAGAALSLKAQQTFSSIANLEKEAPDLAMKERYAKVLLSQIPAPALAIELEHAIVSPKAPVRRLASELYTSLGLKADTGPLVRRVYYDADPGVRQAAAKSIAVRNDSKSAGRISAGLKEQSPIFRMHTAEALGEMGRIESVPELIKHWNALVQAGSSGAYAPRAYFFSGTVQSYVAGYDVEVAQAAAIAHPIVSTLQSGVVLDVRVIGAHSDQGLAIEKGVVHDALVKIAKADFGNQPKAWADWYQNTVKPATGTTTVQSHEAPATPSAK